MQQMGASCAAARMQGSAGQGQQPCDVMHARARTHVHARAAVKAW